MSSVFKGITNLATGGLFGANADNQSPFNFSTQVGEANTTALKNYNDLYKNIGANQTGYVSSVVNPTIATNALGYGNLLQDQSRRGIRGSSFGNADIGNYQNVANRNVQDATSQALMQSYGLLGNVNQGIAGMGNNIAQQQLGAQGANTQIKAQNLKGNMANMDIFGRLAGAALGGLGVGAGSKCCNHSRKIKE